MRRQGLRSKVRRKFVVTTDTKHDLKASPNLLNRSFDAGRPNEVWVSDITYLSSRSGWLYLVVFIDLFSRRVVGWCVSTSLAHETVLTALHCEQVNVFGALGIGLAVGGVLLATIWSDVPVMRDLTISATPRQVQVGRTFSF